MPSITDRNILVGVTGGIAAYKSAELVRRLVDKDSLVRVAMTSAALHFISPLTLQAVSMNPVHHQLLDEHAESAMSHIELARWADSIVIAPATADFIAKLSIGLADDLLTTICLACKSPIWLAPSMNTVMWENQATQQNITRLADRGIKIIGPGNGYHACGEIGLGRMAEPDEIISSLEGKPDSRILSGVTVVVTAGPTWEALDPVRGLTNHSSGKMGYAIAKAAHDEGATVNLISGPTTITPPKEIKVQHVTTALEMLAAVENCVGPDQIFIGVAAVADYRPETYQQSKIKKNSSSLKINLVRNPDILENVANRAAPPFTVGFAVETSNTLVEAQKKLKRKKLNLMIANEITDDFSPFGNDENSLVIIDCNGKTHLGRASKTELARALIHEISCRYHAENSTQDT
ncbi:MAG: bifunctional phosphopantothenoylcysteine decarboxylase/phosphopantothenate--cysteine ligase CoaBC [Acidiferrobacteraceae bacterium]|nr:bifunctional phosphopantothenoylcysteine decarboxylase/phosphopantothenate--cysteine ligase CoaBC [Acidiferrobacteraceae bacterium]